MGIILFQKVGGGWDLNFLFLQGRMLQRSEAQSRFALYEEEEKGEQTFYLQYLAL